ILSTVGEEIAVGRKPSFFVRRLTCAGRHTVESRVHELREAVMVGNKVGRVVGLLLLVVGLFAAPAGADDAKTWPVKHRLLGTDGAKSTDVSGIACTTAAGFPRSCLVIDDNSQSAQLVTLEDGKIIAGKQVELISN